MGKGKTQQVHWECVNCGQRAKSQVGRNPRAEKLPNMKKFCNHMDCRGHQEFKAKDTKKGKN